MIAMHTGNFFHKHLYTLHQANDEEHELNHVQLTKSPPPFTCGIVTETTAYFHGFGVSC